MNRVSVWRHHGNPSLLQYIKITRTFCESGHLKTPGSLTEYLTKSASLVVTRWLGLNSSLIFRELKSAWPAVVTGLWNSSQRIELSFQAGSAHGQHYATHRERCYGQISEFHRPAIVACSCNSTSVSTRASRSCIQALNCVLCWGSAGCGSGGCGMVFTRSGC
jgi:hypothetical protein